MHRTHWKEFLLLTALLLLAGCAMSENYKMGQDLMGQNRPEEAIAYFEAAVLESRDNTEYQAALQQARQKGAAGRLERVRKAYEALKEPDATVLDRVLKDADSLAAMDPSSREIKAFRDSVKNRLDALLGQAKNLYAQADLDIQKEDWNAARTKLLQVNRIFPNYEETATRLARVNQEGARQLYQQGVSLSKQEDWKTAAQAFQAAMEMNPNFLDVAALYKIAVANDNAAYFLGEGEKAEKAKQWDRAIFCYQRAREYEPSNQDLAKKLENLRVKTGQIFFEEAEKLVSQGRLNPAVRKIESVKRYLPSMQEEPVFRDLLARATSRLIERGNRFNERELWGNALMWYQKAESLSPNHPELFQKIQDARERIGKRIRKSIAVFDFSSPSNDKDAGKMAADKLVAYLYQKASSDLRIIERENLQNILREMQLGQTGLVDVKSAQAIKMRGIDTFIMGNVLKVMATKADTASNNQVRVLLDEEDVPNPEWQTWLIMHPRPTSEEMKTAPPKTMKKRNYQFVTYKQGNARIVALFDVSYKLVDTTTGENIFTNTIEGRLIKEDKYQDGVPMANIPQDPLQLPTEAEVLSELTNGKISEMGQSVLRHFQSLEVEYFNAGEQLRKRRKFEEAVEKYVDALYDIKLKGISTAVAQKSQEMIDGLLQEQ
ncbi:MAG: hypothetical protein HPY65_06760 [Syntrophaceae bacterium]|nr:hypothetical protein [Syntrophaceae bacterium]